MNPTLDPAHPPQRWWASLAQPLGRGGPALFRCLLHTLSVCPRNSPACLLCLLGAAFCSGTHGLHHLGAGVGVSAHQPGLEP